MPLITAVRRWIGRRTEVTHPYVPHQPITARGDGVVWMAVILLALPLIGLLVFIGLVYEVVIRIDQQRRLGSAFPWAISVAIAIAAVVMGLVILDRL